jgi:anthranilate phosphoribosyltransferase
VLLNSAAALVAAGRADHIRAGLGLAGEAIDSENALQKLEQLIEFSQENG